jgi:hypothetical protein
VILSYSILLKAIVPTRNLQCSLAGRNFCSQFPHYFAVS